jgi:hypothetical protein
VNRYMSESPDPKVPGSRPGRPTNRNHVLQILISGSRAFDRSRTSQYLAKNRQYGQARHIPLKVIGQKFPRRAAPQIVVSPSSIWEQRDVQMAMVCHKGPCSSKGKGALVKRKSDWPIDPGTRSVALSSRRAAASRRRFAPSHTAIRGDRPPPGA